MFPIETTKLTSYEDRKMYPKTDTKMYPYEDNIMYMKRKDLKKCRTSRRCRISQTMPLCLT